MKKWWFAIQGVLIGLVLAIVGIGFPSWKFLFASLTLNVIGVAAHAVGGK